MKPQLLLVLSLLLLTARVTLGQVLWQDARAGMAPEQVLKAFPEAKWNDKKTALSLPTVIVEKPFTADFQFKDNALSEVVLRLTTIAAKGVEEKLVHEKLLVALRSKYGPEHSQRTTAVVKTDWSTKDGVGVELSWMKGVGFISVRYSLKLAAEKL